MKLSSINNTVSNINNSAPVNQAAAKNAKPSLQTQPDIFIKSSNVSFQGKQYITFNTKNEPTDEVLEHIKALENTEPPKVKEYSSRLDELTAQRAKLADEAEEIKTGLLKAYENNSNKSEDGRKIEIQNAKLIEFDNDGKAKREAVFRNDEIVHKAKKGLFGRLHTVKVKKPRLVRMVEHNEDGTVNIISNDTYFKNYKKDKDGSISYDSMTAFGPTKRDTGELESRFELGYRQDSKGNKHRDEILYSESARIPFGIYEGLNVYRKNENTTSDGSKTTADIHYNYNLACIGTPAQYCYEGYEENGKNTSYKKGVTVWCNELYGYRENYKENENGKNEWDVFYEKDDGQYGYKTKGQWYNVTPEYREWDSRPMMDL